MGSAAISPAWHLKSKVFFLKAGDPAAPGKGCVGAVTLRPLAHSPPNLWVRAAPPTRQALGQASPRPLTADHQEERQFLKRGAAPSGAQGSHAGWRGPGAPAAAHRSRTQPRAPSRTRGSWPGVGRSRELWCFLEPPTETELGMDPDPPPKTAQGERGS